MGLTLCGHRHGGNVVIRTEPAISECRDVFYLPVGAENTSAWGIYDAAGHLSPHSGYYRGPERHLVMQPESVSQDLLANAQEAPDAIYIYAGSMHPHYGHFLLSTLSRFWHLRRESHTGVRFVMHAGNSPQEWFQLPHVSFLFQQVGLTAENFVCWDRCMRLRRLIVPEPSFHELLSAHTVFATLGHAIGDAVDIEGRGRRNEVPAYLCKGRLQSGVWRVRNENEFADCLAQRGVDIVYPEELSLPDQIRLFQTRSTILATVSSGLHTSILASDCATIIGMNHDANVVSNYSLIDSVNGNDSHYYYPENGIVSIGADQAFSLNFDLLSPQQTADDLLRLTDAVAKRQAARNRSSQIKQQVKSLDALGVKYGTDRSSAHHDVLRLYEPTFQDIAAKPRPHVLEIGCGTAGSLQMLESYFPDGEITGLDIDRSALRRSSDRIVVMMADQSNILDLTQAASSRGPFDLILDDGSHQWDHQITSFRTLYPFLRPGGAYIIEHVETSFGDLAQAFQGIGAFSTMHYLQLLSNAVAAHYALPLQAERDASIRAYAPTIASISFLQHTCIIRRKLG